jgi:hypothetical protein
MKYRIHIETDITVEAPDYITAQDMANDRACMGELKDWRCEADNPDDEDLTDGDQPQA